MQEGPLLVDENELPTAEKLLNEEFAQKADSVKTDAKKTLASSLRRATGIPTIYCVASSLGIRCIVC